MLEYNTMFMNYQKGQLPLTGSVGELEISGVLVKAILEFWRPAREKKLKK